MKTLSDYQNSHYTNKNFSGMSELNSTYLGEKRCDIRMNTGCSLPTTLTEKILRLK